MKYYLTHNEALMIVDLLRAEDRLSDLIGRDDKKSDSESRRLNRKKILVRNLKDRLCRETDRHQRKKMSIMKAICFCLT